MKRGRFCIIKVHDEYFASNSDYVIDVINGCNKRLIELFLNKENVHLIYKSKPVKLLNAGRIFVNKVDESIDVNNVLVIKHNSGNEEGLYGLPINDVIGVECFDDNLLIASSLVQPKAYCSYSFKHGEKLIHMLDINKIIGFKYGNKVQMPVKSGIKIYFS